MRRTGLFGAATVALMAAVVVLSACADERLDPVGTPTGATSGPTTQTPSASPTDKFTTTTPGPIDPTGTPAPVSEERWEAIVDDLATRGVPGEPDLVSSEAFTWPDGALGCPEPGASYTQAIVQGLRVLVRAGGNTYDYRFGDGDSPRLCRN